LRSEPLGASLRLVFPGKQDRPYLDNWLRRTRRQLAASGRLSEIALILSRDEGNTPEHWSAWLRSVLEDETTPSLDLLTKIDGILARPIQIETTGETAPLL
jgi:hypothetical protein